MTAPDVSGLRTTYPIGQTSISHSNNEICGYNTERQDTIITPTSLHSNASHFKGYFCAHFDTKFSSYGVVQGSGGIEGKSETQTAGARSGEGPELSAYAHFAWPPGKDTLEIVVRVGTSFIATDQARITTDLEIPSNTSVTDTIDATEDLWTEKVGRFELDAPTADKTVFLTAVYHALQVRLSQPGLARTYADIDNASTPTSNMNRGVTTLPTTIRSTRASLIPVTRSG